MAENMNERIEKISDEIGDLNARLKEQIDSMINICNTVKDLAEQVREAVGQDPPAPPPPPHPRWKPENGEMYRFIDDSENVAALHWSGDQFDLRHFDVGNMFKMNDDAAFAIERLKVLAQMREWAGRWNDPYRILYIDGRVEPETVYVDRCISYGEICFATEADAKNCIKAVGEDRLKKYYFGISTDNGCCTSER